MDDPKLTRYLGIKTTDEQLFEVKEEARIESRQSMSEMARVLLDEAIKARKKARVSA
jgi:hypothetical protein